MLIEGWLPGRVAPWMKPFVVVDRGEVKRDPARLHHNLFHNSSHLMSGCMSKHSGCGCGSVLTCFGLFLFFSTIQKHIHSPTLISGLNSRCSFTLLKPWKETHPVPCRKSVGKTSAFNFQFVYNLFIKNSWDLLGTSWILPCFSEMFTTK